MSNSRKADQLKQKIRVKRQETLTIFQILHRDYYCHVMHMKAICTHTTRPVVVYISARLKCTHTTSPVVVYISARLKRRLMFILHTNFK